MAYQWDFGPVASRSGMLLQGLLGTVEIAVTSISFGVAIGLGIAAMRLSDRRVLRTPAAAFVGLFRNTPAIVWFFWFYYALPVLVNVSLDPFVAAVLALSTQSGAFYSEVFRGAIAAVPSGQWEGAKSLGMDYFEAMRRIILPQAARRMVAPFVERSFELTKTTALASTLSYGELLYRAMQVNSETYRPLEVYSTIAVMYFLLLLGASVLARIVEHRITVFR